MFYIKTDIVESMLVCCAQNNLHIANAYYTIIRPFLVDMCQHVMWYAKFGAKFVSLIFCIFFRVHEHTSRHV